MTEPPHDPNGTGPLQPEEPAADPGAPPPPPPPGAEPAGPSKDERNMALLSHLLGIVLGLIGPLIIWLIKKDESPFVDDQGKEAMNFQITVLITMAVVSVIAVITCGFGAVLALPVMVVDLVFCIIAALKANEGVRYRYPLALRLVT